MNLNRIDPEDYHHLTSPRYPKPSEAWYQLEDDLWRGAKDVLINTAALREREMYFDVIRVTQQGTVYQVSHSTSTL